MHDAVASENTYLNNNFKAKVKHAPFKGIFSNVGNYINSEKIIHMSSSEENASAFL